MSAVLDEKPKKKKVAKKGPKFVVPGLGEKLRRAREIKDLSLRELGAKVGMSGGRICQLENGDGNAKLINFVKLIEVLGMTASEALDLEVDERAHLMILARKVRAAITTEEMEFLAELNPIEAKVAVNFMHAGVDQFRKPREEQASHRPTIPLRHDS